ncbi:MAG TPA: hypothetical protein DCF63_20720 [Planctomycetaceae bacterium]|nr:hypothetical protein [Planctomycetaceae bacterium]
MTTKLILAFLSISIPLTVGCGEPLIQVSGSVLVDGKPAEGAVVLFHPDGNDIGTVSSAVAGPDGKIAPVTDMKPGMLAGDYRVTVTWTGPPKPSKGNSPFWGMGNDADLPDKLKGKYVSKEKSGLTATVESSTLELQPFELTTNSKR